MRRSVDSYKTSNHLSSSKTEHSRFWGEWLPKTNSIPKKETFFFTLFKYFPRQKYFLFLYFFIYLSLHRLNINTKFIRKNGLEIKESTTYLEKNQKQNQIRIQKDRTLTRKTSTDQRIRSLRVELFKPWILRGVLTWIFHSRHPNVSPSIKFQPERTWKTHAAIHRHAILEPTWGFWSPNLKQSKAKHRPSLWLPCRRRQEPPPSLGRTPLSYSPEGSGKRRFRWGFDRHDGVWLRSLFFRVT